MTIKMAKLRKSGGAVIVTIPKAYLDRIGLTVDASVQMEMIDDTIVIARPRSGQIGLAARLALCKGGAISAEEREWFDAPRVGKEAI